MAADTLVERWIAKAKNHPFVAVVCVVAITLGGLASFSESVDKLLRPEHLDAVLLHSVSQGARIERYASSGAIDSWWEAVVSNTGDRTSSLSTFMVRAKRPGGDIEYAGAYDNLIGRVADAGGERTAFPITVEPGHSTRLYLELKVLLNPTAFEVLSKAYPDGSIPSLHVAGKMLAQSAGIDPFGQKAAPLEASGDVFGITVESSSREPRLEVTFQTSRGNSVSAISGWYSGGKTLKKGDLDVDKLIPK